MVTIASRWPGSPVLVLLNWPSLSRNPSVYTVERGVLGGWGRVFVVFFWKIHEKSEGFQNGSFFSHRVQERESEVCVFLSFLL